MASSRLWSKVLSGMLRPLRLTRNISLTFPTPLESDPAQGRVRSLCSATRDALCVGCVSFAL